MLSRHRQSVPRAAEICEPQLNLSAALVGGADSSARVSARRAASTSPSASCASASTSRRIQLSACASPGATVSSAAPRIADANQVVAKKIPRHANGWIRQVSIGLFQFLFQCDFEFPARLVIAALRGKNGREESHEIRDAPNPVLGPRPRRGGLPPPLQASPRLPNVSALRLGDLPVRDLSSASQALSPASPRGPPRPFRWPRPCLASGLPNFGACCFTSAITSS